jgi:hypothetical protein
MLTVPTSVLFRIHSRDGDGDEDGTAAFAEEVLGAKPIAQAATIAAITPIPTPVENDALLAVATPGGVTHVAREADALPTD